MDGLIRGILQRLQNLKEASSRGRWRWIGYLLTIMAVAYLLYTAFSGDTRLQDLEWKGYWRNILGSIGLYLISLVLQFIVWIRMVAHLRQADWLDLEIYARTTMMRRLPGGIWHWVGKTAMYSSGTEVPSRDVLRGSLLEWLLMFLTGLGILIIIYPLLPPPVSLILSIVVFAIAIWIGAQWQPAGKAKGLRVAESLLWLGLYTGAWLLGAGIFHLATGLSGAGQLDLLLSFRLWTISAVVSVITVLFPATLGIQEAVITYLLTPYIQPAVGLAIAISLRVIFILSDLIWGGLGSIVGSMIRKS